MEEVYLFQSLKDPNLYLSDILEDGFPIRTVDKRKALQYSNEEDAITDLLAYEDKYGVEYSKLFDVVRFVKGV